MAETEENGEVPQTPTSPVISDVDLESALEQLGSDANDGDVQELLKMMNENRIITWEEAEQIMCDQGPSRAVKSSLPPQSRPTEPDNETDVEDCVRRLLKNDPSLQDINLNNMKRTPIPLIQRMIMAIRDNTWLEKLSLANTALNDMAAEPLLDVLENNEVLRCVNLETNYLSGEFLAKLFKSALKNQSLEEVKCVNQSMNFSTQAERDIIEAIQENRGLTKVSIKLRLPEGRHKIENRMIRNAEIRRILRKQEREKMKDGDCGPGFTKAKQDEVQRKMSKEPTKPASEQSKPVKEPSKPTKEPPKPVKEPPQPPKPPKEPPPPPKEIPLPKGDEPKPKFNAAKAHAEVMNEIKSGTKVLRKTPRNE